MLQQDAASDNDAYCGEAKQEALLEMVLAVHQALVGLVEGGIGIEKLEQLDLAQCLGGA